MEEILLKEARFKYLVGNKLYLYHLETNADMVLPSETKRVINLAEGTDWNNKSKEVQDARGKYENLNTRFQDFWTKKEADDRFDFKGGTEQYTYSKETLDRWFKAIDSNFVKNNKLVWDAILNKPELMTKAQVQLALEENYQISHNEYLDAIENSNVNFSKSKIYTDTKISNLVNASPEALDTLNELASALGNDPNFSTTVMQEIGKKANKIHQHEIKDITNFPTSLPANGGTSTNSNQLGGFPSSYFIRGDNASGTMDLREEVSANDIKKSGFYRPRNAKEEIPFNNHSGLIHCQHSTGFQSFQISSPYVVKDKIYFRNKTQEETWNKWNEIYHTGFKPTYEDVGAAPLEHYHDYIVNMPGSGNETPEYFGCGTLQLAALKTSWGISDTLWLCGYVGEQEKNSNQLVLSKSENKIGFRQQSYDSIDWGEINEIYHTGFKPSAEDVGALPVDGIAKNSETLNSLPPSEEVVGSTIVARDLEGNVKVEKIITKNRDTEDISGAIAYRKTQGTALEFCNNPLSILDFIGLSKNLLKTTLPYSDYNALPIENGFFRFSDKALNGPTKLFTMCIQLAALTGAGELIQISITTSGGIYLFIRQNSAGTWGPWVRIGA